MDLLGLVLVEVTTFTNIESLFCDLVDLLGLVLVEVTTFTNTSPSKSTRSQKRDSINSHLTSPVATCEGKEPRAGVGLASPDGGYGWLVVAAAFGTSWIVGSMFAAFSILYVEWTEYYNSEKGVTGWIGSLYMASGNFLSMSIHVFHSIRAIKI